MTFENALKKIQAKFAEIDASKLADMAVQVSLTDEDCGGTLYFKVTDGSVDVQGYDYRDNDAVMDIERKAFMDILSGKLTLDKAIEKGQATVNGNFEKLDTLKSAIPAYVAPKKTEAKTTEAEKEVKTEFKVEEAAPAKKRVCKRATKTTTAAKKTPAKTTTAKKITKKA